MGRVESYGRFIENALVEGHLGGDSVCDIYSVTHDKRDSAVIYPFGSLVVWDATDGRFELPSATGQTPKGIVVRSDLFEYVADGDSRQGYPTDQPLNLMEVGLVYVYCEEAWDEGDDVYFRHTANGAGKDIVGRFRTDDDTANADQLVGASFRNSGTAAGIALLKINLP